MISWLFSISFIVLSILQLFVAGCSSCSQSGGGDSSVPLDWRFIYPVETTNESTGVKSLSLSEYSLSTAKGRSISPNFEIVESNFWSGDSNYPRSMGLSPSGDLWYRTPHGLFYLNMNGDIPKTHAVISAQSLATDFVDATVGGYYSATINSVIFLSDGSDQSHYWAVISYSLLSEGERDSQFDSNFVVFDSKDGSLRSIWPFKLPIGFTVQAHQSYLGSTGQQASSPSHHFYYTISDRSGYFSSSVIRFDPATGKHELILLGGGNLAGCDVNGGYCYKSIPMDFGGSNSSDFFNECDVNAAGDIASAKRSVAACVNRILATKSYSIVKANFIGEDVTSDLASADSANALYSRLSQRKASAQEESAMLSITADKVLGVDEASYGISCSNVERPGIAICGYFLQWYDVPALNPILGTGAFYYKGSKIVDSSTTVDAIYRLDINDGSMKELFVAEYDESIYLSGLKAGTQAYGDLILARVDRLETYNNDARTNVGEYGLILAPSMSKVLQIDVCGGVSGCRTTLFYGRLSKDSVSGITDDNRYLIFQASGVAQPVISDGKYVESVNNSNKYYYMDLNAILTQGSAPAPVELVMDGSSLWPSALIGADLYWLTDMYSGAILNNPTATAISLYVNKPFSADESERKLNKVTSFYGNSFQMSPGLVPVPQVVAPSPSEADFDIAADTSALLSCGGVGIHAKWCKGDHEMCEGGTCVKRGKHSCAKNSECDSGRVCSSFGKCERLTCFSSDSCPIGSSCKGGNCKLSAHDDECVSSYQCTSSISRSCRSDAAVGYNRCQAALPAGCTTNAQCAANKVCTNGACVDAPNGPICSNLAPCASDKICIDGQCVDAPEEQICSEASPCVDSKVCIDGACVDAPHECDRTVDCRSGFICIADHTCYPKMSPLLIRTSRRTVNKDGITFKEMISWDPVMKYDGTQVDRYIVADDLSSSTEVSGNSTSAVMYAKVAGNLGNKIVNYRVQPIIVEKNLQQDESDQVVMRGQAVLSNVTHCMLPSPETVECPSLYNCDAQKNVCSLDLAKVVGQMTGGAGAGMVFNPGIQVVVEPGSTQIGLPEQPQISKEPQLFTPPQLD